MQEEKQGTEESTVSLSDIFRVLRKNVILIAVITVCIFILGAVYTFAIAHEKYTAKSTVIVSMESQTSTSGSFDYTNSLRIVETVASLATEDIVLDEVAEVFAEEYGLTSKSIASMVKVTSSTSSYLVAISVTSEDPDLARDLANTIAEKLIDVTNNTDELAMFKGSIKQTSTAKEGVYSSPNKVLYLAVSLIAGLAIACVVAFLKEFTSTKFQTKNEIEQSFEEKVIGYFVDEKNRSKKTGEEDSQFELLDPSSRNCEQYNILLNNIKYSNLEHPYQVIMTTSSRQGELKSTVICNLAVCMNYNRKKVVIIDLDTRKPVIHRRFKVSKDVGLVEYIEGEKNKDEIIKHSESGVDIITAGKKIINPIVVIEHSKVAQLIKELRETYDYVLVDAPPALLFSDAGAISKLCDGVIFNVSMKDARKREAKEAVKSLKSLGTNIIGINITKGNATKSETGYYGYHYYGKHGKATK